MWDINMVYNIYIKYKWYIYNLKDSNMGYINPWSTKDYINGIYIHTYIYIWSDINGILGYINDILIGY